MIDGLRPDAIATAGCSYLQALCARGTWTLSARSVLPLHHAALPHVDLSQRPADPPRHHQQRLPAAGTAGCPACSTSPTCTTNAAPLAQLGATARPGPPEALHFAWYRNTSMTEEGDDEVAAAAVEYIQQAGRPDFAFVYLGTVDSFGHFFGWMSAEYLAQGRRGVWTPSLGGCWPACRRQGTYLFMPTTAGWSATTATTHRRRWRIPWVLAGPQVRPGHQITAAISLLDTAPTFARLLDIPVHPQWEGRCVEETELVGYRK